MELDESKSGWYRMRVKSTDPLKYNIFGTNSTELGKELDYDYDKDAPLRKYDYEPYLSYKISGYLNSKDKIKAQKVNNIRDITSASDINFLLVNNKVKTLIEANGFDKNIQFQPILVKTFEGTFSEEPLYLLHPYNHQDVLNYSIIDSEKFESGYSSLTSSSISSTKIDQFIDTSKIDSDIYLFRIKNYQRFVIVNQKLAQLLYENNIEGIDLTSIEETDTFDL